MNPDSRMAGVVKIQGQLRDKHSSKSHYRIYIIKLLYVQKFTNKQFKILTQQL
tara:strand:- start:16 stop:174 length:159 start_codon:yes stop_codon:yes gene_type:complete